MLFVVLCPGTPEGSTGSDSGFKASQKTGQRLKVSSDRLVSTYKILLWPCSKKKNFLWLSLGRNQYRRDGL